METACRVEMYFINNCGDIWEGEERENEYVCIVELRYLK